MNSTILTDQAIAAKKASILLASASEEEKNKALRLIAERLKENKDTIIEANRLDLKSAKESGTSAALLDRLALDEKRIDDIADGVLQVATLPDPLGEIIEETVRPNGLKIKKIRVPFGVIGMIYEARPNVTVDAAALSLKAGSAVILRGSGSALESNRAIVSVMKGALSATCIPPDVIALADGRSRETVDELLSMKNYVDLIIPRGGAGLIKKVVSDARVPVLETGVGNCHIYIDKNADYQMAENIVINAKTQRPAVCNAAETIVVHKDWSVKLPSLCSALAEKGVTIHGCTETLRLIPYALPAEDKDFEDEYLSLDIAVKIVDSEEAAIAHIRKYGTGHTEVIITDDKAAADVFIREIDAACVNWNASSRFTDGYQFGFGAEIGISTQKMHARGPLGLREITSYKYIVEGSGQTRQ